MFIVAIVSASGGTGKTSLTANIATLLPSKQQPVLALELEPSNRLDLHFGLAKRSPSGLINLPEGHSWQSAIQRNADQVNYLPFGTEINTHLTHEKLSLVEKRGVRHELMALSLPPNCMVLIDTQRAPSLCFDCAIATADLIINVITAQPACFDDIAVIESYYEQRFAHDQENAPELFHVLNQVNSNRVLTHDIITMLRDRLGNKILRYVIHQDAAIPEAMASNKSITEYAPGSQANHDLQGLANWLLTQPSQ
jgi:cellulose synthase operon protein YhjQ